MEDTVLHESKLQPINKFHVMNSLKSYKILKKLGQGTFGVVQRAKNVKNDEDVALKQLLNHSAKEGFPITAMREITILKHLHHKNILKIIDMVYEEPKVSNSHDLIHQRGCFYTVSPYMASDLVGLLENPRIELQLAQIKCFMVQLLHGIEYIHKQHVLHRDIKAANILIDFSGVLKIGDFGLARMYHGSIPRLGMGPGGGERAYTGLVVTRWYRPPELLLGERKYTTAVDMWGVGCVFAELFTCKPILVGQTDSHQAQLVFNLVGPPNIWVHASTLPNKLDFNIGLTCKRSLEERFKGIMPPDGINLLSGLLTLDPYKRLNALDALLHSFFLNNPLPLEPQELPKFEESHEIDKDKFKKLKEKVQIHQLPKGPSHGLQQREKASANKAKDPYDDSHIDRYVPLYHSEKSLRLSGERGRYSNYRSHREPHESKRETITSYLNLRDRSPNRDPEVYSRADKPSSTREPNSGKKAESSIQNKGCQVEPQKSLISVGKAPSIFMSSSRHRRFAPSASSISSDPLKDNVTKRTKQMENMGESDLTDFDEDVEESDNLNSFLSNSGKNS
ncbi:uncharacterized protein PRCAT00000246001 [Priceomyces carsonii]|uniref:uncharacterized protein n=1 Tax=Priceomyces carsonii TaxID=28549 RepID=UPI002EDA5B6D|nr:unnamed protein product [Priceomyces carsonii]